MPGFILLSGVLSSRRGDQDNPPQAAYCC